MNRQVLDERQSPLVVKYRSPTVMRAFSRSPVKEDRVRTKIESFANLEDGWDFGIGEAACPAVIELAVKLYKQGSRTCLEADAFPGTGGEIYIAFYKNEDTVEICVNLDLSLALSREHGTGAEFEELDYMEDLDLGAALDYLNRFSKEILCTWSEPYIAISTTESANDLRVTPSRTTKEVYQLSTPIVSGKPTMNYVHI